MNTNKQLANYTLMCVAIVFLMSAVLRHFYGDLLWIRMLAFVAEAALVGGIADWYAVTALFKKPVPLLPQPHAAIIPRNRIQVEAGIIRLVEDELLSLRAIKDKIKQSDFFEASAEWIEKNISSRYLAFMVSEFILKFLRQLDAAEVAGYLERLLKDHFKTVDLGGIVSKLAHSFIDKGEDEKWIGVLLEKLIIEVQKEEAKQKVYDLLTAFKEDKVGDSKVKGFVFRMLDKIDAVNLNEAAALLHRELLLTLQELQDAGHPLRIKIKDSLRQTAAGLDSNQAFRNSLRDWQIDIVDRLPLQNALEDIGRAISDLAGKPSREIGANFFEKINSIYELKLIPETDSESLLIKWISIQIENYWVMFKKDNEIRVWVNSHIRDALYRIVQAEYYLVGEITRETLDGFSDKKLNEFINSKVGNDLQWIRVNGSIIGGAAGLAVFVILNFIWEPLLTYANRL